MKVMPMRVPAAFVLLAIAFAPAVAQPSDSAPTATMEALRRDFPADHVALAAGLAGKSPDLARRAAYAGIDRFLRAHRDAILAAPGPALVALEARQGALLRTLGKQNVQLCAIVGDRGLFSEEALAGPAPAGLDEFGAALVEAAKAGAGAAPAPRNASARDDALLFLATVEKIEPGIPFREMLSDRARRAASSPDQLCRGAAAMHEAAASLPDGQGQRMSRTMLGLSIGSPTQ
jgi:hypothetical protein